MQTMVLVRRAWFRAAISIALLTVVGCVPTQVGIQARFPANYPDAADLHRLAIANFGGRGGDAFTASLRAEVTNAVFDGEPSFSVVNVGGGDAVQAARRAGVDGVLFGETDISSQNEDFLVTQQQCIAEDSHHRCVQYQNYQIPCTSRTILVTASPQVLRVGDSRIVYAQQKSASSNTRWCQGQERELSDDALVAGAFNSIAQQIRRDIAPYNTVLNATIIERHDGLPRDAAAQFDQAVAKAQDNNIGEACRIWTEIAATQPHHIWTIYNLGVCAEATGDFQTALSRYRSAQQMTTSPDGTVAVSIKRVSGLMGAQQQLAGAEQQRQQAAREQAERATEAARQADAARNARRADLVARYGAATADAILAGRVSVGMSRDQVIASLGQPTSREPLTPTDEIWQYGSRRISFSNGRVAAIRD